MQIPTFIRLENSFERAMYYRDSPDTQFFSFNGIHLATNNPFPYIQATNTVGGIEIDTYVVKVKSVCSQEELGDISDYFYVVDSYVDPVTGYSQFDWKIAEDCPFDFGQQLVYLEIETGIFSFIYSSPFIMTADNAEFSSQWFYTNDMDGTVYSIGLGIWYRQDMDEEELENYTPVSTGKMFNVTSRLTPFEIWQTNIIDTKLFRLFKQIFLLKYRFSFAVHDGGYPVSTGLKSAFETPKVVGKENFGEAEIELLRDYDDIYDPFAPPIPPPPIPVPQIVLNEVLSINKGFVNFYFDIIDFAPEELTYQYSLDQISWTSSTQGIESPQEVYANDNHLNGYYYRIIHFDTGIESNIVQQPVPEIEITNITSPETEFDTNGNHYSIFFTKTFTNVVGFSVDVSTDGDNWVVAGIIGGNLISPISIQTLSSSLEFKYFRVKYNFSTQFPFVVTSNEYFREF